MAIWQPEAFEAFTDSVLDGVNAAGPTARQLKRFYFNASADTELDAANRVMIPGHLMSYADLSKEVTVTGSGECLEIWDRGAYARNFEDVLTRIPDLTASLGHTA